MPSGKPLRIPLVTEGDNRWANTNMDAKIVNAYMEKSPSGEVQVVKRPGYNNAGSATGNGNGMYEWKELVYAVYGTDFYSIQNGATTPLGTVDGNSFYTFSAGLGATPKLFLHNNAAAYTYDSGAGLVQVIDVDYPTTTVPGTVWLDGTTYVMDRDAYIYGSALNDPQSWNSLNKIQAQIEPDTGIAIARQLSYLIAFKQWSTEVFYNAGNATGSPLARQTGSKLNYGCYNARTVVDIDGTLFWLAQTRSGVLSVVCMTNLSVKVISTPAVERIIRKWGESGSQFFYAYTLSIGGHAFYILTVGTSTTAATSNTFVYDVAIDYWYQWTAADGSFWPFSHSAAGIRSAATGIVFMYLQGATNGNIATVTPADPVFLDGSGTITMDIITPNFDGQTRRKKYLKILDIVADQTTIGNDSVDTRYPANKLNIRFSADDYNTWSNFRTVDLNERRPRLYNCGTFVQRAYHFQHKANAPVRLRAVEMQIEEGTL